VSSSLLLNETCKFKLEPENGQEAILDELFRTYSEMVRECFERAMIQGITFRRRLHAAVYKELREKYPPYPSHYIYTAITQALATYRS